MGLGSALTKGFARVGTKHEAKKFYGENGQEIPTEAVAEWEPSLLEPAVGAALGYYLGEIPGGTEEEIFERRLRYALYGGALGGIGTLALGALSKKANHTPQIQAIMTLLLR